ncbi:putative snoal-like polyketide cyclase family protein [Daldinia childiae]|uniref:putative snoal-like polyketide cyclase family protein n=1 Tax=Daldinia childiae TaxID=326645 RepID=UPI0014462BAE|nr:putative snoal-like polyketide cyclase family protein [Daldinia childiae]KAF3059235.1 putative snoal-like polyketide cyclase family protein [Daldinia childiae]
MRASTLFAVVSAPLMTLAVPVVIERQGTSKFCTRITPAPSAEETEKRFNEFADLFLVKKDVYKAFEYILPEYINHNPLAEDGAQNALDILGPIWGNQSITVLRTKFGGEMSWLNYKNSFGEIVDRFRWEDGCIIEHWDQGETFPTSCST